MNFNRNSRSPANSLAHNLAKLSKADLEGSHRLTPVDSPADQAPPDLAPPDLAQAANAANAVLSADFLPEDEVIEAVQAELYPEILPPVKKHSSDYLHRQKNRQKVRQIAEARLTQLSDELLKLADEVRYYHPLMAEAIDDAWDATEEAISLMASET